MSKPPSFCFLSSATRWCSLNFALQSEPTTKQRLKPRLRALRMWLDMQATFLEVAVFPPPSAGAEFFAQGDGACARLATYAGVELVVQAVIGHGIFLDKVPDIAPSPIRQRIELFAC